MKKILVPCDFSEAFKNAYKFALDLAALSGGEILVLKVIDLPFLYENAAGTEPYYVSPMTILTEIIEDAKTDFETMQLTYGTTNSNVSFQVEKGSLTQSILRIIDEYAIDLVVMGTQGVSGMRELFIGSNTEKIVRKSPVPVFAIHEKLDITSIKNIVFPTNLDPSQSALIEKIKVLQNFFKATLHILYVSVPENLISDAEIMVSLKNFATFYQLENFTVNIRHSQIEQNGIIKFASIIPASIIAMATQGHTGVAHLLSGSIAEDVVNHAHEPIWTYSQAANQ